MYTIYKLGKMTSRGKALIFLFQCYQASQVLTQICSMMTQVYHQGKEPFEYEVHYQETNTTSTIMMTGYISFPVQHKDEIGKEVPLKYQTLNIL